MYRYQLDRKYLFIQVVTSEPAGAGMHLKGNLLTAKPEEAPWLLPAKSIRIIELMASRQEHARPVSNGHVDKKAHPLDLTFFTDHKGYTWVTMPPAHGDETLKSDSMIYDRFIVPKGFGYFRDHTYSKYPFTELQPVEERLSAVIHDESLPIHVTRAAAELQTTIFELSRHRTYLNEHGWDTGEIKLERP